MEKITKSGKFGRKKERKFWKCKRKIEKGRKENKWSPRKFKGRKEESKEWKEEKKIEKLENVEK